MIEKTVKTQISKALKEKDEVRLMTLRMLASELHNAKIEKRGEELAEEEELKVVKAQAKMRKDAIEAYEKAGVKEKVKNEKKELEILSEFLPEEMGEKEIEKIVLEVIKKTGANSMTDMGSVMGESMKQISGKADGNRVSSIVRKNLS